MIKKSEFLWNFIGSFISAMFSAIILAFCTRLNTLDIAGIFSICYATACVANSIGDFGIRVFQVTDTKRKYNFKEYYIARIIALVIMIIFTIFFVLFSGYRGEKLAVCLLLVLMRLIDNLSETYQAEFQLNGRLDYGGKSVVYRTVAEILVFLILDIITRNVVVSLIGLVLINAIIFVFYDMRLIEKFVKKDITFNKNNVISICRECIPIAVSTLISMYVINATKYAIDGGGDYTIQTYFNILYMPTFVINLVSMFVLRPFLKPFGDAWNNNNFKKFLKIVLIIAGILALSTVIIEIGSYIMGIEFLNLLYKVDLSMYRKELLLLIMSGLLYALSNLFFNALSTMRAQKTTTISYALTAIFALLVPKKLVMLYGMNGAVLSSIIIMGMLCVLMGIFFVIMYMKKVKEYKDTK